MIIIPSNTPSVISDPLFSSVRTLLHGDGVNNSTTITDSSSFKTTWLASGTAKISTTQSKFGGSSIYVDGTSTSYIYTSNIPVTAPWCMEFWIYQIKTTACGVLTFGSSSSNYWNVFYNGSFYVWRLGTGLGVNTSSVPLNQWNHVVLCVTSAGNAIGLNGTMSSYGAFGTTSTASGYPRIGTTAGYNASNVEAYFDDIRITNNSSRYGTGQFTTYTVPTDSFPDQ